MSRQSGIDDSTLRAVLSHYDFYNGTIDGLTAIPQRLTNLNARFRIGDKQWVIKRYTDSQTPEKLALSHQVQTLLAAQQFPVAHLEQTGNGKTLVALDHDFYSIHEWISGTHIDGVALQLGGKAPDEALVREIAHALGRFHRLMREHFAETTHGTSQSLIEKPFHQPASLANRIREKRQAGLRRLWRKVKPNKSAFERWLDGMDPLLAQADEIALMSSESFRSPRDLIVAHNDLNWENLIFDDAQHLKAIIDFDNVVITHRMLEVGAACIIFTGTHAQLRQAFLETYQHSSGLDIDMYALQTGMKIKCLRSLLWSAWSYQNNNIVDEAMLLEWCTYLSNCLEGLRERK